MYLTTQTQQYTMFNNKKYKLLCLTTPQCLFKDKERKLMAYTGAVILIICMYMYTIIYIYMYASGCCVGYYYSYTGGYVI